MYRDEYIDNSFNTTTPPYQKESCVMKDDYCFDRIVSFKHRVISLAVDIEYYIIRIIIHKHKI